MYKNYTMKSLFRICFFCAMLGMAATAQTVDPAYQDGVMFLRVATTTPQVVLPVGDDPQALLAELSSQPQLQDVLGRYGLVHIHKLGQTKANWLQRTYVVKIDQIHNIKACITELGALPQVELAERRALMRKFLSPNDTRLNDQWYITKIQGRQAWDLSTGSTTVKVAVVDDAVLTTHEDLSANLVAGKDVSNNDNNPSPPASASSEDFSHGTHCAGLVAGVASNGKGIAGIGYSIKIIPVKATSDGSGGKYIENAYEGVDWAMNNGAQIISMSWGSEGFEQTGQDMMTLAHNSGIILVAAAGNENTSSQLYPAAYSNVMAVAATDQSDRKSSFSNYGTWVDISAPGVNMLSTVAGANNNYEYYNGTSMATPLVAGLLGLAKSYKPTATNTEIINCLYSSADNISSLNTSYTGKLGAGRINAYKCLQCLGGQVATGCSGQTTLTASSGTISDGSGSSNYTDNQSCSWLIQPSDGGKVQLTFSAFTTEATYDMVKVYNGTSAAAQLVGTYSGSTIPAQITSTGNALFVTFTSDASNTAAGWTATWTSIAAAGSCSGLQTLTANSGTITDGSGSETYPNNASCSWKIQPANGGKVQLTFNSLNTEADYDLIKVYDGNSTSSPLLGTYSGTTLPAAISSSGNVMFISFTSDGSITGDGFSLSWTSTTAASNCSGLQTITDNSGSITDGSGTNPYANDANCSWKIQPADGGAVTLNFTSFATEQGWDFVKVYDGISASATLLGAFSGSSLPPSLTSSGNAMYIAFTSDDSQTAQGFSATYSSTPVDCDGLREMQTASATISDGPSNYGAFADCSWHINPVGATSVSITFTQLATEADYDFVRVYDGADATASLLGEYSGSVTTPFTLNATGGELYVELQSDYSVNAAGFTANYTSDGELFTGRPAAKSLEYKVYPNPANTRLTLEAEPGTTYTLMNQLGQPVLTGTASTGHHTLSVDSLPRGLYTLQLRNVQGHTGVSRIVLQ